MVADPYLSSELLEGEVLTPIKVWQNFLRLQQSQDVPSIITIPNHMYDYSHLEIASPCIRR